MGARGRKPAHEVALAERGVALVSRPDPPLDLTPEQSDEWNKVVDALPADWFQGENHPLLIQYCRHIVDARRIAQLIDQECSREELDIPAYAELLRAQRQESAALKTLAASMRLAQQSKYNALSAGTAGKNRAKTRRPWESD